jgi:predicted ribosomally synthesized peptide with nif11-like leader
MAKEQVFQFIAYVNSNQGVRDKLKTVTDERLDGMVQVARDEGFDFTVEELQAVIVEQLTSTDPALSDEALETIVGGGDNTSTPTVPAHIVHKHIAGIKFE